MYPLTIPLQRAADRTIGRRSLSSEVAGNSVAVGGG